MKRLLAFLLLLSLVGACLLFLAPKPFSLAPAPKLEPSTTPLFVKKTLPPAGTKSMHAATLSALNDNYLVGAYFGGSAEGVGDVKIYAHLYNLKTQEWGQALPLLSAPLLSQKAHEFVKILGNPVLYATHNTLYLFVVGASLGGWATSKIYLLCAPLKRVLEQLQHNQSPQLDFIQTLPLSPFLNISHLVRTSPLPTDDGGFVLPIYQELAKKTPLLLKFDPHARLERVIQPNLLKQQLQPSLVPYQHCALMAFRSYKRFDLYTQTCQTPLKWDPPQLSNLKNYDDSLNLFNVNGTLYLIYNAPLQEGYNSRSALMLAQFASSLALPSYFKPLGILDFTQQGGEVSYPATLIFKDQVHVLYTKDRQHIQHIIFNLAYLKSLP